MAEKPNLPNEGEIYTLLGNQRRRRIVHHLVINGGSAKLRDISEAIATRENNGSPKDLTSEDLTRVYISLYSWHIPALEDYGIVEYDEAERTVSTGDRIHEVFAILGNSQKASRKVAVAYLVIAISLGTFLLATVSNFIAITESNLASFTIGAALASLCLAAIHYSRTQFRDVRTEALDKLVS